jgi:hypothetical protein
MCDRPDPVKWLERLVDVNARSDFTSEQKIAIAASLRALMQRFGANIPTTV